MPIVEAVGSASFGKNKARAAQIQAAMAQAVADAIAEGVSVYDATELLRRQMAARDAVKRGQ
jgi:formaldehyde-activating enzyme involved in methanogenesis